MKHLKDSCWRLGLASLALVFVVGVCVFRLQRQFEPLPNSIRKPATPLSVRIANSPGSYATKLVEDPRNARQDFEKLAEDERPIEELVRWLRPDQPVVRQAEASVLLSEFGDARGAEHYSKLIANINVESPSLVDQRVIELLYCLGSKQVARVPEVREFRIELVRYRFEQRKRLLLESFPKALFGEADFARLFEKDWLGPGPTKFRNLLIMHSATLDEEILNRMAAIENVEDYLRERIWALEDNTRQTKAEKLNQIFAIAERLMEDLRTKDVAFMRSAEHVAFRVGFSGLDSAHEKAEAILRTAEVTGNRQWIYHLVEELIDRYTVGFGSFNFPMETIYVYGSRRQIVSFVKKSVDVLDARAEDLILAWASLLRVGRIDLAQKLESLLVKTKFKVDPKMVFYNDEYGIAQKELRARELWVRRVAQRVLSMVNKDASDYAVRIAARCQTPDIAISLANGRLAGTQHSEIAQVLARALQNVGDLEEKLEIKRAIDRLEESGQFSQ